MKWPTIAPAWCYGDPSNFIDRLLGQQRARGLRQRGETISLQVPAPQKRDRYYTQWRHLQIRKAMRGNACSSTPTSTAA